MKMTKAAHSAMEEALKGFTEGERIILLPLLRSLGRAAEQYVNATTTEDKKEATTTDEE